MVFGDAELEQSVSVAAACEAGLDLAAIENRARDGLDRWTQAECTLRSASMGGAWLVTFKVGGDPLDPAPTAGLLRDNLRIRHELADSVELFQLVLDTIPSRVFWKDSESTFLGCNQVLADDAGCASPDELIGKNDFDFPWRDRAEDYRADDAEVMRTLKSRVDFEEPLTGADGEVHWLLTSKIPLRDHHGVVRGVLGTYSDITSRKLAEVENARLLSSLESKNAELERFTYTVSHDLKSPLVTINGFLGVVEEELQAGQTAGAHKALDRIRSATRRMGELMDDLLEMSTVGRAVDLRESVDLNQVLAEAVEQCAGYIRQTAARVQVAKDLPSLRADRTRLVQVFQNLIENACKYAGEGPPAIDIRAREGAEAPTIEVADRGIGIPADERESVFGLFEKLDYTSEGSGIGLALVKRIVNHHGGEVWIEDAEGGGACFCLSLPGDEGEAVE